MFDPVALRSLLMIRRTGSVNAAAEHLGYTPSAVSQQIKRLERAMGAPLLERVGRGVVLTPAAHVLADDSDGLLEQIATLQTRMQAATSLVQGDVRLAAFSTAIRGLLPGAFSSLRDHAPAVKVHVREVDPWDAINAVASGAVDLAVVHNWEPLALRTPSSVTTHDLGVDEADVLMSEKHPLARHQQLQASDLLTCEWITVRPGSICHQWLTALLANAGGEPNVLHEIGEYDTQLALLPNSNALALIPRLGRAPLPDGVVSRPVRQRSVRKVTVAQRRSTVGSPAFDAVVSALRDGASKVLKPTDAS